MTSQSPGHESQLPISYANATAARRARTTRKEMNLDISNLKGVVMVRFGSNWNGWGGEKMVLDGEVVVG